MSYRLTALIATVVLATALWFVTFYLTWASFWIKISLSAAILATLSLGLEPRRQNLFAFNWRAVISGLLSAVVLYGIFWAGKQISALLFPFSASQIGSIYDKGAGTSMGTIALLLFLVTGPCEEIYWRGYLQRNLMERFGNGAGWALATTVYAAVHIWSLNFMLIGAAAVAGAFWGALYWRLKALPPVIVSHSVWSTVIFAVFPMT